MDQDNFAIPGDAHALPRHPEKILSSFDLDKKDPTEDHIHKFMLALRLMNVEHEDIVYKIFPFTFEGKDMT